MTRFIAAGTGPSVREGFTPPPGYTTVGVNDIASYFIPDHMVVMDSYRSFLKFPKRLKVMEKALCHKNLWCQQSTKWPAWHGRPDMIHYKPKRYGHAEEIAEALRSPDALKHLPHAMTTTYTAISLSVVLGATWVGVIGLDLIGHHLAKKLSHMNDIFGRLHEALQLIDVELVNLSDQSLITTIPYGQLPNQMDIHESTLTLPRRQPSHPEDWEEIKSHSGEWVYVYSRNRRGDLVTMYRYPTNFVKPTPNVDRGSDPLAPKGGGRVKDYQSHSPE